MKSPAWFFFLAVESSQSVGSAVAQNTKEDEMKKLAEREILLKANIKASPDGTRTYVLGKSLESLEGGKGILVLLYPARTMENLHVEDSTDIHLLNHMKELGLKEYGIATLFSAVTQSKLFTRGFALDAENLNYIKDSVFGELKSPAEKIRAERLPENGRQLSDSSIFLTVYGAECIQSNRGGHSPEHSTVLSGRRYPDAEFHSYSISSTVSSAFQPERKAY